MSAKKPAPTPEMNKNTALGCLILIVIGVVIFAFFNWASDEADKFTPKDFEFKSYQMSKSFVEATLKAPSTADFPFDAYRANYLGDSTFVVISYVDAQNSFGAKIRTNWKTKVKYKGGDWTDVKNWTLLDISLQE